MYITYEQRAAVALVQITRKSRYVFMECKKSAFHVNHIRAEVIELLMRYVKSSTYVDTIYCLKIIKQVRFLHINGAKEHFTIAQF